MDVLIGVLGGFIFGTFAGIFFYTYRSDRVMGISHLMGISIWHLYLSALTLTFSFDDNDEFDEEDV